MTKTSQERLKTCHPDLQKLIRRVAELYPIQVSCGYRSNEDQEKAFKDGKSKAKPGESKHNQKPSRAVDIIPDPDHDPKTISWTDLTAFEIMCYTVEAAADELDIKIRLGRDFKWGADWPHIELV
jgi:peptidoglycan L-alanyl-D-glutamate endopeptidase CwlK